MLCGIEVLSHPLYLHLQGIKIFRGSNKQDIHVFASEAYVGGPSGIDWDVFDLFARGVEYGDPPASQVNVARFVDGHAVGAHFSKECPV